MPRCWLCCSARDCDARKPRSLRSSTCSSVKAAGSSSTWLARAVACALCPCLRGPKLRSMSGPRAAGISEGPIFRSINRGGRIGSGPMSSQAVFNLAVAYMRARWALASLLHTICGAVSQSSRIKGHAGLEQIQLSLGHASIQTTERYLGVRQDLSDAPCDRLGLKPRQGG